MSWDLFLQDYPKDAESLDDLPEDFEPEPLGSRSSIQEKIRAFFPAVDFSDPAWGRIAGPGFDIDIDLGNAEPVECITLHVSGGDPAPAVVADLVEALGLRALDSSTGDFFVPDAAESSCRKWREYRDRVVGGL
jgi:hypothetical protein